MPGCRPSESQPAILVVPEGALSLNGPALKIVGYCDGKRTFNEIVDALEEAFPGADRERIKQDTANLLGQLRVKRVLTWEDADV